ncbi:MAG TPA: hypothetical protein VKD90_20950 [Gemmataceae bacterium]|nr:hypothetical protein [Gemmataceae bacterium]
MPPDPPKTAAPPARARYWLGAWALLIVALFLVAGVWLVQMMRSNQKAAEQRHAARLDPAAEDTGVTAADRTLPAGAKPTEVLAGIYVDRIVELAVKDVSWTVEFYLWFRWRGEQPKTLEGFQVVDGSIESKDLEFDETVDGQRYQRFRVTAKITKFFDVTRYPCEDHLLTIGIEHPAHLRHEVLFVADAENSSVSSRVNVPAYRLRPAVVLEKPHSYKTTRGDPRLAPGTKSTYSQLRMGIGIERAGWGLFFKLFQFLFIAVMLALVAFFIRPIEVDPRFGLGVGALFAAVANAYVVSSHVPDTGVMALADIINGVGIALILLTVVQSTISLYLFSVRGQEVLSRTFDRLSFAIILPGYVLLNAALAWSAIPPSA